MAEVTVKSAERKELALLEQLYQLKAKVNEVLGKSARVEINITDVDEARMRFESSSAILVKNNGRNVTIQSIAGRINITDDSMPF